MGFADQYFSRIFRVLSISGFENLIASGSFDKTIKYVEE